MTGLLKDLIDEFQALCPELDSGQLVDAITRASRKNITMSQWTVEISPDPIEMEARKQRAFRAAGGQICETMAEAKLNPSDRNSILYTAWIIKP